MSFDNMMPCSEEDAELIEEQASRAFDTIAPPEEAAQVEITGRPKCLNRKNCSFFSVCECGRQGWSSWRACIYRVLTMQEYCV